MTDTRLTAAFPPLPSLQNASSLNAPRSNAADSDSVSNEAARAKANEFEATFLASLLQPVFEGLAKDRTFGGGFGEEAFTGLLTQEYAKGIAGNANLGIADQVYEQLVKLQETPSTTGTPNANTTDTTNTFKAE